VCLAVPMRVEEIEGSHARVESAGVTMEVDVSMVPEVIPGEYVIVHAGFAIERLKPEEAEETLELIREMVEVMEEEDLFSQAPAGQRRTRGPKEM
jgi:hydrogenase expression/formation protein HypC